MSALSPIAEAVSSQSQESPVNRALLAMFTVIGGGVFRALGYSLGYGVQGSRRVGRSVSRGSARRCR
jgi:hypothetical protein